MAANELKPCKKCGGNIVTVGGTDFRYYVFCFGKKQDGTYCKNRGLIGYTPEDAITAWNRRQGEGNEN